MKEWVQAAMKEDKSHEVLVLIGENAQLVNIYAKELMTSRDENLKKTMIFICNRESNETTDFERDEFDCDQLSEETINKILQTQVTFQGRQSTIDNLVVDRNRLNEILDSSSIEEILFDRNQIIIPSFDSQEYEKSLWIERSLLPAISNANTIKGIDERCQFNPETNQIEWSMMNKDKDKSIIWNQVKHLLNNKTTDHLNKKIPVEIHSLPENIVEDQQSTVIITGVAGSG
jgi:hypothetical protein